MNQVGKIVKKKREQIGLSQNMLAKKAGISQASLNALESKTNNPSVETFFMLAAALDCTVSELLGEVPAGSITLTPRQKQIIDIFAQLNEAGKAFLLQQAENILSQAAFRQDGSASSAI